MTKQTSKTGAQQDFENCILNVHGIVRQVPHYYCSLAKHIKSKNDILDLPIRLNEDSGATGIILAGETGAGKTELAHFFTETTGAASETIKFPEILSPYKGATAENIHKLFETARNKARDSHKLIILIFENIDQVADRGNIKNHPEYLEAYKQFCKEINQCKKDGNIFIIGTTNYLQECDSKFRSMFQEITIINPQSDHERKAALIGYLMQPTFMRACTLAGLAKFHQAKKVILPKELHTPFDKFMQTLEQLTKKIIALEQNPMYLEFEAYSRDNGDIQELEELSTQLKQHAIPFDPATISDESLQRTCALINKVAAFQVNKVGLFLNKIPFLNENIMMIAHMAHGLNFRDLEYLATRLLNHPKQLTKKTVLTFINEVSKRKPMITNNTFFKRYSGKIIITLLGSAAIAAFRGFIEGVAGSLTEKYLISRKCKKTDRKTPTESESPKENTLPEPA